MYEKTCYLISEYTSVSAFSVTGCVRYSFSKEDGVSSQFT